MTPQRNQLFPPTLVRGRLGAIKLLPQIEEAVTQLKRGEKKIVRVHFPVHYEVPFLRGRTRLMEITLLDCKANQAPPVVEEDLHQTSAGRFIDPATLTEPQREMVANG